MADTDVSTLLEGIKAMQEAMTNSSSFEEAKKNFSDVAKKIDLVGIAARASKEEAAALARILSDSASKSIEKFGTIFGNNFFKLKESLKDTKLSVGGLSVAMGAISQASFFKSTGFTPFKGITGSANEATAQLGQMTGAIEQSKDKLIKLGVPKGLINWIQTMGEFNDAAINMQNRIVSNMAASGQMNLILDKQKKNFIDLKDEVVKYTNTLANIGSETNLTTEQVGQFADGFMRLPGVLNETIKLTEGTSQKMHVLEAAIKVARGTGLEFGEVQKDIEEMTQHFGASAKTALQTISRTYDATQTLGLNFKDMRNYVSDVGSAFKFFGDNSSTALDIMGRFGPALKKSGLGPTAVKEMVSGFTTGISKMTVAQRAFLSGQAGIGGGGLRGGLEIEEMLAEGKVGEVAGKIEGALKKMVGGRFMTRKEAIAGGPGAASQFEFQRQMLQQGPFGQLAGSPEQAAKLLEALAAGDTDALGEQIASGDKALESTVDRGNSLIESQSNVLLGPLNEITKWSAATAQGITAVREAILKPDQQKIQNQARTAANVKMGKPKGYPGKPGYTLSGHFNQSTVAKLVDKKINEAFGKKQEISGKDAEKKAKEIIDKATEGISGGEMIGLGTNIISNEKRAKRRKAEAEAKRKKEEAKHKETLQPVEPQPQPGMPPTIPIPIQPNATPIPLPQRMPQQSLQPVPVQEPEVGPYQKIGYNQSINGEITLKLVGLKDEIIEVVKIGIDNGDITLKNQGDNISAVNGVHGNTA